MPHIRLRGLNSDHVSKLNPALVKELSQIVGSPEDHFTFEHVKTDFYAQGKLVSGTPFVEVHWFPRDKNIQDACAKAITDKIKNLDPDLDVTVVFLELTPTRYYENGKHF
jgi:hypothetical protein